MIRLALAALAWLTAAGLGEARSATSQVESADSMDAHPDVTRVAIRPSETDPAITSFDVSHFVFVDRAIVVRHDQQKPAPRRELLVWLPGTLPPGANGSGPGGAVRFCELAAGVGYHVIVLKYPNDQPAARCRRDPHPDAFEQFRRAIIAGGSSFYRRVERVDSIENRLEQLLRYLQRARADEDWSQFLDDRGRVRWEQIVLAGQSQGAGHAALMGIQRRVARVICFGGPKDHSLALRRPADWLSHASATPKSRFFAFNHQQDRQGCSPAEQRENLHVLGLDAFGPIVDVDTASPPYGHTRCLTTNHPGTPLESRAAHTAVISPRNLGLFGPVWTYLLTEPVDPVES